MPECAVYDTLRKRFVSPFGPQGRPKALWRKTSWLFFVVCAHLHIWVIISRVQSVWIYVICWLISCWGWLLMSSIFMSFSFLFFSFVIYLNFFMLISLGNAPPGTIRILLLLWVLYRVTWLPDKLNHIDNKSSRPTRLETFLYITMSG